MRLLSFLTICILFLIFPSKSQSQRLGRPFIQNFTSADYRAEGQNWDILQDKRGLMYFANSKGILEFDGINWRLIQVGNNTIVRRLRMDSKGKIYVSGLGEFGYLAPNTQGTLQYVSLLNKISKEEKVLEIGFMEIANDEVYFQSTAAIYHWNGKEIKILKPKRKFNFLLEINNKIWLVEDDEIYTTSGKNILKFSETKVANALLGKTVIGIYNYQNKKIMGIRGTGLFFVEGKSVVPYVTEADAFFKKNDLRSLFILPNNDLLASTTTGGIVRLNPEGKIIQKINKSNGLLVNEIYKMFLDNQNGVWLGTGNGLARAEIYSPFSFWNDEINGWTTGQISYNSNFYVTTLGAYYFKNNQFEMIKGIDPTQQGWGFGTYKSEEKNALFYFDTEGLFIIDDSNLAEVKAQKILAKVVMATVQSKKIPNRVYLGLDEGFGILEYRKGKWEYLGTINGIKSQCRSILEDEKGNIWVGTNFEGIKYLNFQANADDLLNPKIISYNEKNGLETMNFNRVFEINNEIVFTNTQGILKFDAATEKFVPHSKFEAFFKKTKYHPFQLHEDKNSNIWVGHFNTTDQPNGVFLKQSDDRYQWNEIPLARIPSTETEALEVDENGIVWIGGSTGLFRYDPKMKRDYRKPYQALIRKITLGEDSLFFNGFHNNTTAVTSSGLIQKNENIPVFEYENNSMTFNYSAVNYDNLKGNLYRHYLVGYEKGWSEWKKTTQKEYTNLSHGDFTFKAQAKNSYGIESQIASYQFQILPPWYLTPIAYFIYAVLFVGFVRLIILVYTRKLKAENEQLEKTIAARTSEIRTQHKALEKSYNNINTLSEIGQEITSTLDIEKLLKLVYKNINVLADASVFGVGIIRQQANILEFSGSIVEGETIPYHYNELHNKNRLSVYCIDKKEVIMLNDFQKEYSNYIESEPIVDTKKQPNSAVYIPLIIENEVIGVLTVQSFHKNAYNENHISLLKPLAAYVAIAVANANVFYQLKIKNQQITDSIRYAQTIQQAVLPSDEKIRKNLEDYFVIYRPKDIVSGDFYWFTYVEKENKTYLAVVDCTGHGVPGAFMSMIANALLSDIVNAERVYSPAAILERLNFHIRKSLGQEEGRNNDGMDISLSLLEKQENGQTSITYAGAKRPLYYVHNNEFYEIKGDSKAIGGHQLKNRDFSNKQIMLDSGDTLYMFTDGIVDQNNLERRRIGTPKIREVVKNNVGNDLQTQKMAFLNLLEQHQQDCPQRDDIALIGVRV